VSSSQWVDDQRADAHADYAVWVWLSDRRLQASTRPPIFMSVQLSPPVRDRQSGVRTLYSTISGFRRYDLSPCNVDNLTLYAVCHYPSRFFSKRWRSEYSLLGFQAAATDYSLWERYLLVTKENEQFIQNARLVLSVFSVMFLTVENYCAATDTLLYFLTKSVLDCHIGCHWQHLSTLSRVDWRNLRRPEYNSWTTNRIQYFELVS